VRVCQFEICAHPSAREWLFLVVAAATGFAGQWEVSIIVLLVDALLTRRGR
jgi:hypothetical protein